MTTIKNLQAHLLELDFAQVTLLTGYIRQQDYFTSSTQQHNKKTLAIRHQKYEVLALHNECPTS